MADTHLALLWLSILVAGLLVAAGLAHLGLSRSHVRDFLHVGAGVWPLGWPFWHAAGAPLAIAWGAFAAMALLPLDGKRSSFVAQLQAGVSAEGDAWSGLVLYTASVATLTSVGLLGAPFPAAAALLALALGDGVGGAVGLAFGRHRFRVPGAKPKSLEGSVAVAVASAFGVWLAAGWFSVPVGISRVLLAGVLAALAEAASPRSTDNLVLPAVVWAFLSFEGFGAA